MKNTMLNQAYKGTPPEAARECGTCTLCCKVFDVPVLNKPSGQWCGHCKPGQGCAIHATRPQYCRDFFCLWISQTWLGPEWKPSISKIVLTISPLNGMLTAQVDANTPNAWRKDPYYGQLKRWAEAALERGEIITVFVGKNATVILPDRDEALGEIQEGDRIVPETLNTARGPALHFKIIRASEKTFS
ncbi:MAG: hypothetical protein ACRCTD_08760 [Beijerinckiaceae bacterium]